MLIQDFINRTFSLEKAKKAKNCRLCDTAWLENDDIYIMRNPANSTFELVCLDCGNKIKDAKNTIANLVEDLYSKITELREIIKK